MIHGPDISCVTDMKASQPCERHRNNVHSRSGRRSVMAQTDTVRSERINLRLSETAKRRIEHAASVEGKTVSAFIVSSALDNAEKTVRRHETVRARPRGCDAVLRGALRSAAAERPPPCGPGGARPARRLALTQSDALIIEPLERRHDRAAFSCGLPELDHYFARQAGQDVRRRIARGVRLHRRRRRYRPRLLHSERPVDRPRRSARPTLPETCRAIQCPVP